ncbi:L,D-transpeptidase [Micromonospora cathayae]|uniref:L,D-transpeptidase n=1 Tax=Micromonospora cathayae TaxID=3028804 RepID=A0ABY7ZNY1_9ACTN|nr:L,D-transpeptidase [Micromonospora sp. HUAS 3]WDZ84647.1 L,D-transpeptidase [Micromonospora sp. HUAS 3]
MWYDRRTRHPRCSPIVAVALFVATALAAGLALIPRAVPLADATASAPTPAWGPAPASAPPAASGPGPGRASGPASPPAVPAPAGTPPPATAVPSVPGSPVPSQGPPSPAAPAPVVRPAPDDLPVITYRPAPGGFPADPDPLDTTPLTEGLRPLRRIAAHTAPGGRPLAFLAPTISGYDLVMPITQRHAGWAAVLLPSANRRIAWVPPGGWRTVPLTHQLVVERRTHRLTWLRHGRPVRSWPVTLGKPGQSTPLGRTFVLARSAPAESTFGGVDVLALGSVPEEPANLPARLRGAHIGIHAWYHDRDLGRNTSNGCVRLTRDAQRHLVTTVPHGTPVVVVDRLPVSR